MKKFIIITIIIFAQFINLRASDFYLIENNKGAKIYYSGNEPVVTTAVKILISDSKLISAEPIQQINAIDNQTIIVGVLNKEAGFRQLLAQHKINTSDIENKWEAFKIQTIQANGRNYLFIIGSDPRGTAYGVLELSRQMGISPWVWWADVIPEKKENIQFIPDNKVHTPSVQYRGIFLNDEDWALMPWSTQTFEPASGRGAIGSKTYARIFELLLRLRANMICPAMHECTVPFYRIGGNKVAAEKYGIIVSTSHAEPMMRTNTGEWDSKTYGPFNYFTNKDNILSYWDQRVDELKNSENIYTTGLRGIHDGRMQGVSSIDEETETLENVIEEQRKILKKHHPDQVLSAIPQIFVPYKEVLKAYNNGLKLPEDITLIWCDDTNGYLMRLSDTEEQKRSGGAGVYYHISYWGKPHDYLWLASTQPALIYTEMKRAWEHGSRRYWVLNVGDIKPGEYLTEFFLDMAWDINSISSNTIYAHQQQWIENTFNNNVSKESIDYILKQYYHLGGQRKPEHMGWNKVEDGSKRNLLTTEYARRHGLQPVNDTEYSPFCFGDEIAQRINACNEIAQLSDKIYTHGIPEHLKAAYFQLVHYPVKASAAMNRKILYAQKARLYARYQLPVAAEYGKKAIAAYNEITALDYTYNKDMLWGKWNGMMDMKPRDLPVFQEPVLPIFKTREETGILIWVENDTIPTNSKTIKLPDFTKGADESYFVTIYPKTASSIQWNFVDKPDFIHISEVPSDMLYEKRLIVSLKNENIDNKTFRLKINEETYTFFINIKGSENFTKYTERNKMIALNASDYTNTAKMETIEGLGHSGNAVKLPAVEKITSKASHLEYTLFTDSTGEMKIKTGTIFRYPAIPENDLRYAVVVDKQNPQIVSVKSDFLSKKWADDVLRNQCLTEFTSHIDKPGRHTIKIYALDEELVFDQILFDFDLNRKQYIIPAEKQKSLLTIQ